MDLPISGQIYVSCVKIRLAIVTSQTAAQILTSGLGNPT